LQSVGAKLRTDLDLLDEIWPDRAALPAAAIYAHERAPVARTSKLAGVRAAMKDAGAEWHFVSTLDDIAWLTNLRGADVTYNPVFLAHLLVGEREAMLFVGAGKVPGALEAKLKADGFSLAPYADAAKHLARLTNTALLVDPKRITYGFRQKMLPSVKVIEAINPSTLAKSRKTAEEVEQIRRTMEHDGAALAEFLSWLEGALAAKGERITEITVDERLAACRAGRPNFVCPSFSTIAGFNANGAMPHYRATPASHATIDGDGMLLIDSGGQYETGTTDITRVIPVGHPSAEMKRDYTLVLKGMIALSMAKFPRGTRSPLLDTIARAPIWAAGVDFGHGTGHGVGYFLNVHEGPHGITPHLPPEPHTAMEPGMITSNEPGIYRPGQWGVRIENLVLNVPAEETEFGEFLKFETLTLCPIDTRLIERTLMRADEIAWLNDYHAEVKRRVGPLVAGAAKAWLETRTSAI
jgi:Xaa-Pro aminopeptidase